jgi:acyl-CoA dehydrogenase
MAKRPGFPTAASPISIRTCLPAPARRPGAKGCRPSSCRRHAGFEVSERIDTIAPHPLATLRFTDCRVPKSALIGKARRGLQDRDVGARHLPLHGRARRSALPAARWTRRWRASPPASPGRAARRSADGAGAHRRHGARCGCRCAAGLPRRLGQGQRRAARDPRGGDGQALQPPISAASDRQGRAAARRRRRALGQAVEKLYREIRALRIYEGASDVQKIVIARQTLGAFAGGQ